MTFDFLLAVRGRELTAFLSFFFVFKVNTLFFYYLFYFFFFILSFINDCTAASVKQVLLKVTGLHFVAAGNLINFFYYSNTVGTATNLDFGQVGVDKTSLEGALLCSISLGSWA